MTLNHKKFTPALHQTFTCKGWRYDEQQGKLSLYYTIDDQYEFCEEFTFLQKDSKKCLPVAPDLQDAFAKACNLLLITAGVSYYKTCLAPQIALDSVKLEHQAAHYFEKLYKNGLAEFAYNNKVELSQIKFPTLNYACNINVNKLDLPDHIVVPLGGGKDSLVSVEILKSQGTPFTIFTLGEFPLLNSLASKIEQPVINIKRKIDPLLFELNKQGALNGHVPISAIIAACLPVAGILLGFNTAVLSNESSANLPNIVYADRQINHQYSKSFEFEQDFRSYLQNDLPINFNYYSLLRPVSELGIAALFSKVFTYDQLFSSCNKNFTLSKTTNQLWCLKCPKCYSTFLCLAPFCSPERLISIFSENLLDCKRAIPVVSELIGLQGHKPFECVIDYQEAKAALHYLSQQPVWQNFSVVKWFKTLNLTTTIELPEFLHLTGDHFVPKDLLCIIETKLKKCEAEFRSSK